MLVHRARVVPDAGALLPGEVEGDKVGTGEGALELMVVQPEGKPAMSAADWLRGARPLPGERLGEQGVGPGEQRSGHGPGRCHQRSDGR